MRECFDIIIKESFGKGWESFQILIPAILYLLQNNLLFVALGKLDPATYQILAQFKILTTAFFSVIVLKKKLELIKWLSLLLLMGGITMVQLPQFQSGSSEESSEVEYKSSGKFIGFICIIISGILSGISGVYLEKIVKHSPTSIWIRNIQLSGFALIPATLTVITLDGSRIQQEGLFVGYSPFIWFTVFFQAGSGLLVAVVVKYADTILKGFATSISLVLSSLIYMLLFAFQPSLLWFSGAIMVLLASLMYNLPPTICDSFV